MEGWLYLVVFLDLFSRRIVGWAMSERMTRQLALDALTMALLHRQPPPGLIRHSDYGSQYARHEFRALLSTHGIRLTKLLLRAWELWFGGSHSQH